MCFDHTNDFVPSQRQKKIKNYKMVNIFDIL